MHIQKPLHKKNAVPIVHSTITYRLFLCRAFVNARGRVVKPAGLAWSLLELTLNYLLMSVESNPGRFKDVIRK